MTNPNQHPRFATLLALLLGGLAGCSTPSSAPGNRSSGTAPESSLEVLRIGVTPGLAPIAFKQNGELAGIEVELGRAFAKSTGRTPRFVELPWTDQIGALLQGRIDIIMSGMSITPARAMRVAFAQPWLRAGQTALVRRSEQAGMQLTLFSAPHRIGVQPGTTGEFFTQQHLSKADLRPMKTPAAGAAALVKGRIDAFIHDAPVNWWLASVHEADGLSVIPSYLTEEHLAWAVRKDDTALLHAADHWLTQAKNSGELKTLIQRWIPFE